MRILAIRLARFGDIVLLFPALGLLKESLPGCHLTFLTDKRWKPLAEMCPAIDAIIAVDRISMRDGPRWRGIGDIGRLALEVRRRRFDLVVDLHGFRETNLLAWSSGARKRLGLKRFDQPFLRFCFNLPPVVEDKNLHVSEMFLKVARQAGAAAATQAPAMVVPETARLWARQNLPARRAVLFMGAPVAERLWPPEGFAEVANHLVRRHGVSVVAVPGPGHEDHATRFLARTQVGAQVQVLTDLEIPQLAALIDGAQILISNDTGPMHLGPALGVPTLGLFSVGIPSHFRPAGKHDRFLHRTAIETIRAEEVIDVVEEMWATFLSDLPR